MSRTNYTQDNLQDLTATDLETKELNMVDRQAVELRGPTDVYFQVEKADNGYRLSWPTSEDALGFIQGLKDIISREPIEVEELTTMRGDNWRKRHFDSLQQWEEELNSLWTRLRGSYDLSTPAPSRLTSVSFQLRTEDDWLQYDWEQEASESANNHLVKVRTPRINYEVVEDLFESTALDDGPVDEEYQVEVIYNLPQIVAEAEKAARRVDELDLRV